MKRLSSEDIRKMWLSFFESKGHKIVESAPLVPINDDSLLWVNAGVTPLKKYFDGTEVPENRRLTNIQKCIRTNDIENVGVTKRHQTYFEMMGNFSIGDYFKPEAIEFAFELLTSEKWFGIDKDLLYVTVYPDDTEAFDKWVEVGLDASHLIKLEENFWEIGEGPCGPDSEIFFDRGEKYDPNGDALEKFKNDDEQERYVEIWNNVFSQFNSKEGVDRKDYKELPSKNIDTGAGLERWCTIFQDVDSNFDTDLFEPIIKHVEELTGFDYHGQMEFKVIVDHIRALTFALSDGATFENTGRGYVLRRLLRRSNRMGQKIGLKEPFMYKLVSDVVFKYQEFYPNLVEKRPMVEAMILEDERQFLRTLDSGERRLKELVKESNDGTISGEDVFKLYDTYGFPFELTLEYLEELGYTTSREEFDKYMTMQREIAKKNSKNKTAMASQKKVLLDFKEKSEFVYKIYRNKAKVIGIFSKDNLEEKLEHDGYIALNRTCFYSESGGQVSDTGMIIGKGFKARVVDVFKGPNGQHIHKVRLLDGVIHVGDLCEAVVDKDKRKETEANHSSVHLLQYSLRTLISDKIYQAGSYVDEAKLRFDFTYPAKISDEMLLDVEKMVNELINNNLIVATEVLPLDKAKQLGAMALFSEKYKDNVRVVKMGKSMELCGGTHVNNTRDIKKFAIFNFESKGSNLYRVEAATGSRISQTLFNEIKPLNDEIIKLLMKAKGIVEEAKNIGIKLDFDIDIDNSPATSYSDIIYNRNELSYVQNEVKNLEKKFFELREKATLSNLDVYKSAINKYMNTNGLIMKVNDKDVNLLKSIGDTLVNEVDNLFVLFINIKDNNSVNFIARTNSNVSAGLVIKEASVLCQGNGGGSPTFAQGGGKDISKIDEVVSYVEERLNGNE